MRIDSIGQKYDISCLNIKNVSKMEYAMFFKIVPSFCVSVVKFWIILPYVNHVTMDVSLTIFLISDNERSVHYNT